MIYLLDDCTKVIKDDIMFRMFEFRFIQNLDSYIISNIIFIYFLISNLIRIGNQNVNKIANK